MAKVHAITDFVACVGLSAGFVTLDVSQTDKSLLRKHGFCVCPDTGDGLVGAISP
jgi:hypothetical protein